tara:strand:+ start:231 stop:488 length:258 start_codon:yes stop_codon:yes gene_type:complete
MIDDDAVDILSISPIDVIDNLDDYYLTDKQKEALSLVSSSFILSLDNDIVYDAIYYATKYIDLDEYYRAIIKGTIDYLTKNIRKE